MATNRIDILNPALLRPGRIDRNIEFPNPNLDSRVHIMTIHSRKMNLLRHQHECEKALEVKLWDVRGQEGRDGEAR